MLQAKLFSLSPTFPEVLSLTSHPRGQSLFSTYTEVNRPNLILSSHTLSNILALSEVKFHTSLLNENRMPLWTPGAENSFMVGEGKITGFILAPLLVLSF